MWEGTHSVESKGWGQRVQDSGVKSSGGVNKRVGSKGWREWDGAGWRRDGGGGGTEADAEAGKDKNRTFAKG